MPPGIVSRGGAQFVRLDNGVEIPESMWADLNNQLPPGQAHAQPVNIPAEGPVPSLPAENLGVTQGIPAIPNAPAEYTPGTPSTYGPPAALPGPALESQTTSGRSSYSTEQPYRRTDVTPPPGTGPYPALEQAINGSRNAEMQQVGGQLEATATQQSAIAGKQQFLNGIDEQGNLNASSGTGRLLEQQRQNDVDRQVFDDHVRESMQAREQRIGQRIAQIPAEDPGRMWQGTEGGLARASGIIASAIGGLLSVSTGSGKNLGLEALQATIDRDIASQRSNIESEWRKVATGENELARFRQQMGDERSWAAEQASYRYASLATKVEAEAGKFDSVAKQAELQGYAAGLMQKAQEKYTAALQWGAEHDIKLKDMALEQWFKNESLSLESRRISGSEGVAAAQADAANQAVPVHTLPDGSKLYIDPQYSASMKEGQIENLRKDVVGHASVVDALAEHRQLIADLGSKYAGPGARSRWGAEDVRAAQDSLKRVSAVIAKQLSGSQYAEAFRQNVEGWVGGARGWTGGDPLTSQNQYMSDLLTAMDRDLGGRGVVEVAPDGSVRRLNTSKNFGPPDVTQGASGNVADDVRSLGKYVLTSDDPAAVLRSVRQLTNTSDASLLTGSTLVQSAFTDAKLTPAGNKTSVRYTGEGADKAYATSRSVGDAVALMRASVARSALKADQAGNHKLAAELTTAADELEQRLRGNRPAEPGIDLLSNEPAVPGQAFAN